jgi:hypothetical protein
VKKKRLPSEEQRAQFGMLIARRDAVVLREAGINSFPVLSDFSDLAVTGTGIKKENLISCVCYNAAVLPVPTITTRMTGEAGR